MECIVLTVVKQSGLKAFIDISRGNLLIATFAHATLGLLFAAQSHTEILQYPVLAYVLLHFTLALFACNVNSYCDYEVDRRRKTYMSNAVKVLGKGNIRVFAGAEFICAMLLILYLFMHGKSWPGALGLLGAFFAFAYSSEPFRIKGKGWLSQWPIFIGLYMLPLIAGYMMIRIIIEPWFILLLAGYAMMNEGFTIVNCCEDYTEDEKEGIRTWAHVLGLGKSIRIAHIFSLAGLLTIPPLLYKIILTGFDFYGILAMVSLSAAALTIIFASLEIRFIGEGNNLEARCKEHATKLSKWFLTTRYPLVVTALLLLFKN
jgi:4-hydroxybenzoate polyprenyltransferase